MFEESFNNLCFFLACLLDKNIDCKISFGDQRIPLNIHFVLMFFINIIYNDVIK